MLVDDDVRDLVLRNVDAGQVKAKAREMGMRSMREDGFRKVLAGITTLDEVLMVTTAEE